MMMEPLRVALDEEDFRQLIAGQMVTRRNRRGETVEIVLSDVDLARLSIAVTEAVLAAIRR